MTPEEAFKEILKLKRLLWLRHGCPISNLYGDDGCMNCNSCMIDFKKLSAEEISAMFIKNGQRKFVLEVNLNASANHK